MTHKKKIAVVTGGAGFIGSHLSAALLVHGYAVRVVDSLVAGRRERVPAEADFFEIDVRDRKALVPIFLGADCVFHCAALPRVEDSIRNPEESHDVNVTGTLNILTAAASAGARRVIFTSSSAIYGNHGESPLREELTPMPLSPYALHKYIGEKYLILFAQLYGLETVSLRFFNVYGPGLNPEGAYAAVIGRFMKLRTEGKPLTIVGDGTQTRDFVQVRDVVRALVAAAESRKAGKGEVLNVGTGHEISVNELANLFGGERVAVPARIEPHSSCADISKAKELLAWEPEVRLADGIAELMNEFLT